MQMAAVIPPGNMEVGAALTVCNMGVDLIVALIQNEGFAAMTDFLALESDEDVNQLARRMASRPAAMQQFVGTVQLKNLQALAWWVRDRTKLNLPVNGNLFNVAALEFAREHKCVEADRPKEAAPSASDLPVFKPEEYDVHEDAFLNLLAQYCGTNGENLRYVVHSQNIPAGFADAEERRMFSLSLNGPGFEEDNRRVYRILKSFLVNTQGYNWIQQYDITENGRQAYLAWSGHYNREGEFTKRAHIATKKLEILHYKNEKAFTFEAYSAAMQKIFITLNKSTRTAKTNYQMVEHLLNGFKCTEAELLTAKTIARNAYQEDFVGACNFLAKEVSTVNKIPFNTGDGFGTGRKRHVSAFDSSNTGRGRGRFGRGDRHSRGKGRGG